MLKIKECKALARRTLAGKYKTVIGAYFINLAISCIMWILTILCVVFALFGAGLFGDSGFSFIRVMIGVMAAIAMTVASFVVGMWFDIGTAKLMLNICRGDKYKVTDVFYGFRSGSNTIGYILTGFFIWLISFGINLVGRILVGLSSLVMGSDTTAGISAALILSIAFTILSVYAVVCLMFAKIIIADKPSTGIGQALKRSRELMRGRMLKGVWLMYLSFIFWDILMIVCSISALWIIPYMTCTTVIFYMEADGTLWQLPDPDRDKARSKSAENAAAAGTHYGNVNSESSSNSDAQNNTESKFYTDSSIDTSTAAPNGTDNAVVADNVSDETDTQDHSNDVHESNDQDSSEAAGHTADDSEDINAAGNTSRGGTDVPADNDDASKTDAVSDARKSDSWEQTINEMHIELPDGFNKTDI